MSASRWQWLTGCIYGECEGCGEALWQDNDRLVTSADRSYHIRCLVVCTSGRAAIGAPAGLDWRDKRMSGKRTFAEAASIVPSMNTMVQWRSYAGDAPLHFVNDLRGTT